MRTGRQADLGGETSAIAIRLYRAVSHAEYDDIRETGSFRPGRGTMEGKWFADTYRGVRLHGVRLYPDGDYHVVAADIPCSMHDRLFRHENLDGNGPATYLERQDLGAVIPILKFEAGDA